MKRLFLLFMIFAAFVANVKAQDKQDLSQQEPLPGNVILQSTPLQESIEASLITNIGVTQGSIDLKKSETPVTQKVSIASSQSIKAARVDNLQQQYQIINKMGWKTQAIATDQPATSLLKSVKSAQLEKMDSQRKAMRGSFEQELEKRPARKALAKRRGSLNLGIMSIDARVLGWPEYLVFSAVQESSIPNQNFYITNSANGTLYYSLTESANWLSLSSNSGDVGTTERDIITVMISSEGLSPGTYTEDITIHNNDVPEDTKKIRVKLVILTEEAYVQRYEYDSNGNLVRRITPNGDIIEYAYDALNRLTNIYYPDGKEVAYVYDPNGNRIQMIDSGGTTNYAYDELNRLRAAQFPGINPIYYEYDSSGYLTKIIYPDQKEVTYQYDSDGRLRFVTDTSGTTEYQYDNQRNNLTKKILPNGVYTDYTYDLAKRITDVVNRKSGGSLISSYHYVYDANNNITHVDETTPEGSRTIDYTYDRLNRLLSATYSDGTFEQYAYDSAGNRLTKTTQDETINYEYDSDNRLLRAGNTIFFYDRNGNLIKKVSPQKTEQYLYDYDNRLTTYADGTTSVQFIYDGDGNRIAKIVNGTRINYVNDVNRPIVQVLMEANSNWQVSKSYGYGLDRISQTEY